MILGKIDSSKKKEVFQNGFYLVDQAVSLLSALSSDYLQLPGLKQNLFYRRRLVRNSNGSEERQFHFLQYFIFVSKCRGS
jgi:hypothetical protein